MILCARASAALLKSVSQSVSQSVSLDNPLKRYGFPLKQLPLWSKYFFPKSKRTAFRLALLLFFGVRLRSDGVFTRAVSILLVVVVVVVVVVVANQPQAEDSKREIRHPATTKRLSVFGFRHFDDSPA